MLHRRLLLPFHSNKRCMLVFLTAWHAPTAEISSKNFRTTCWGNFGDTSMICARQNCPWRRCLWLFYVPVTRAAIESMQNLVMNLSGVQFSSLNQGDEAKSKSDIRWALNVPQKPQDNYKDPCGLPAPSLTSTMPSQLTTTEVRFNNVTKSLTTAANTLELLTASFKTPFLNPISVTIRTLLDFHEVHFPQTLLDSESYPSS
jgi:hypothetical protein